MSIYRSEHTVQRPTYLGGGNWAISNLTDVTVLMGKNGSGKSVLLRSWRDQNPNEVHYVVPERTGEMDYLPQYIHEEFDGARRKSTSQRNFTQDYRRRIVGRVQTFLMKRGNTREEGPIPGNPAEIEQLISALVPDFTVELLVTTPPYSLKRIADDTDINQVDQLSSGEAQLFTIALDILTIAAIWEIEDRQERVMLIDEPDAHIHPDLQARFADFLLQLVDRFNIQFVIATHSTSLMSALGQFGQGRSSIIYIERNRHDYRAQLFDEVTKELAACLGGHVLMGPLFGAPLLLVEGDDDYRIWGQIPRHHVVNFAVLPCNGEEIRKYQRILERILSSLCERPAQPIGFALLDGDKTAPAPNPDNPQDYIRYIKLNCHEAENLYLTDSVLQNLGHTWQSAQEAILSKALDYGEKRSVLEQCQTWDRRQVDIKNVINQIAEILDSKKVPWTMRVGNAIGRSKPSGDLANFLGAQVLNAIWGTEE